MKAIVFVNGTIEEAVEAVAGVRAGIAPEALRAVVCAPQRQQFIAASGLLPRQVLIYSPGVWLVVFARLLFFLGLNRGPQVACLATDHSGGMKLLALALRGRVSLRLPDGRTMQLTLGHFLWLAWQTWGRRPGDICLVGAADPAQLSRILADLRRRHPGARIHGLLSAEAAGLRVDSRAPLGVWGLLAACRRRPRFAEVVIPLTGCGRRGLKLLAWLLPLGFREIYNENNDSWPARDFQALLRHLSWRARNACLDLVVLLRRLAWHVHNGWLDSIVSLRRLAWRLHDAWLDSVVLWRRVSSRAFWFDIPPAVTVLGSASPDRLAAIMGDVRRRHRAHCHGLLPKDLLPLTGLFDSVTPLALASPATWRALLALAFGRHRAGYLVLPYTGEGRRLIKLVVALLPLGRREIYNENNDIYSARDVRLLFRHFRWRFGDALQQRARRWRDWATLPPNRVTVVGSASGLYLKQIAADLRRIHPGAPVHALLPGSLVIPAAHLFDSHTVLDVFSAQFWLKILSLWVGPRRSGYLVVPCTNEGYAGLKLMGLCLPVGRRRIYNENGDSCLVRQFRMMARHIGWRLHHRIFYQMWSERRRRPWPLHLLHLFLYLFRLLAGAAVLLLVRWRGRPCDYRAPVPVVEPPETDDALSAADGPVAAARMSH